MLERPDICTPSHPTLGHIDVYARSFDCRGGLASTSSSFCASGEVVLAQHLFHFAHELGWKERFVSGLPHTSSVETSDGSLLRQFQQGSTDAASRLYGRYVERLRALASAHTPGQLSGRLDADDIVQSVFRTFLRRAREGHYEVPSGEDLWGLLLVITLNKIRSCSDFHQAAKRDVRLVS